MNVQGDSLSFAIAQFKAFTLSKLKDLLREGGNYGR